MNMKNICLLILFEYYVGKVRWNEEVKWGVTTKTTNSTKTTDH